MQSSHCAELGSKGQNIAEAPGVHPKTCFLTVSEAVVDGVGGIGSSPSITVLLLLFIQINLKSPSELDCPSP